MKLDLSTLEDDNVQYGKTPDFSTASPSPIKKQMNLFGVSTLPIDRTVIHRYAFLVIITRCLQSIIFLLLITYIVYADIYVIGGHTKDEQSLVDYHHPVIYCHQHWCTSIALRFQLQQSFVFSCFMIMCLLCTVLCVVFFLLSSPYLLFASSITRNALSLLKTGCIYDSIHYFSKYNDEQSVDVLLRDNSFLILFWKEIIKRRIPVYFADEECDTLQDIRNRILKSADSDILLTTLQLNVRSRLSENVAVESVKNCDLHVLKFIQICSNMNDENRLLFDVRHCLDENGNGLLHLAVNIGDESIVKYILDNYGYDDRPNISGDDVIALIILNGDIQILKLFVQYFQSQMEEKLLKQLFFQSIIRGQYQFTNELYAYLINEDLCTEWIHNYFDHKGRTLLMLAGIGGHANIIEFLINPEIDADICKCDANGKTVLMHACEVGNVNVVNVLMNHPKIEEIIQQIDGQGICALMHATMIASMDIVCSLERLPSMDPNIAGGKFHETPLIYGMKYK